MAQLFAPRKNIHIILPDIQVGGTLIKQVGYVVGQSWTQPRGTGVVSGIISVEVVRHWADQTQPDGLGAEMPAEFQPRDLVHLRGANDTLLNLVTGEQLAQQGTLTQAAWQAAIDAKAAELEPAPVILQGDGLELMRNQLVNTEEVVKQHLHDAPPYHFAPKDAQGQPILPTPAP